jgi:hypothetical protein
MGGRIATLPIRSATASNSLLNERVADTLRTVAPASNCKATARICCLGWGSLIWDPRNLALRSPAVWREDGPMLPIEFARKSSDGRITLVLSTAGPAVPVLWAEMDVATLAQARDNLAEREGCSVSAIGCWPTERRDVLHSR